MKLALGALDSFERIPIRFADISVANAVDIAWEHGIYAYDAYVLECARRLMLPLLSLDGPQRDVAWELGIEVLEVQP